MLMPRTRSGSVLFTAWIVVVTILASLLSAAISGCAAPPELGNTPAANTPFYFSENRAFYLDDLGAAQQHEAPGRELKHLYEFDPTGVHSDLVVKDGSPLSVIVGGVRLPDDLPGGKRDIAVIMDILTSADQPLQSMVVYYQRDVPPGQMLNFQNLLVYYDPSWDSTNPPYYRLRVIDVATERNQRTQAILDQVSNLGASLSGLVPHPIIPAVTTAIEAARLVLGNRQNVTLLDFQVQFYSAEQVRGAGGADLGVLREGAWLVVGRPDRPLPPPVARRPYGPPPPTDSTSNEPQRYAPTYRSDFWREPLAIDRRTGQLIRASDGLVVEVPYVSVVVSSADAQAPKFIMDRSAQLIELLSTQAGKSDLTGLQTAIDSLAQAGRAYMAKRRIQRHRDIADLNNLMQLLLSDDDAIQNNTPRLLSNEERADLLGFVNKLLPPAERHATPDALKAWWAALGNSKGYLDQTDERGFPLGVRWRPTSAVNVRPPTGTPTPLNHGS